MKKNERYTAIVDGLTSEGNGIVRIDGMAVFVPYVLLGETVEIQIVKVKRRFAYGKLLNIKEASPYRQTSPCPFFSRCGGCHLHHMTYEEELRFKTDKVEQALHRLGGISVPVHPTVGSENISSYRNKLQIPVREDREGNPVIGFFQARSHRLISVDACGIQKQESMEIAGFIRHWMEDYHIPTYNETDGSGILRHIYIRTTQNGEALLCLVTARENLPKADLLCQTLTSAFPSIVGILQNIHPARTNVILGSRMKCLWGQDSLCDTLDGLEFQISPFSFYQVNPPQAVSLYQKAVELAQLTGTETVLDFYCGIGTISLFFARKAKQVFGIEVIPEAVENARENAKKNSIPNATFLAADAAEAVQMFDGKPVDVVVIDPPRAGCEETFLECLLKLSPKKIIYISCNPSTLARDLRFLGSHGFAVKEVHPYDFFPRTHHVEAVALLSQLKPNPQ